MRVSAPPLGDLEARARWHLEIGYTEPAVDEDRVDFDDQDDAHCFDCGQLHDMCDCHVGDDCGRWRNGSMTSHCTKAGSEECDFECPYRGTLRF